MLQLDAVVIQAGPSMSLSASVREIYSPAHRTKNGCCPSECQCIVIALQHMNSSQIQLELL